MLWALRLGLLPREFRARATATDLIELAAWLNVEVGLSNDLTDKHQESITWKVL